MDGRGHLHIVLVTGNFPSEARPNNGAFVQSFAHALARTGVRVSVIRPTSVFDRRYGSLPVVRDVELVDSATIEVHRPRFFSFSARPVFRTNTARLTQVAFNRAVRSGTERLSAVPTIVYGHFLYQSGRAAALAAQDCGVPSVVGVGEGTFWTVEYAGLERARRDFKDVSGFVAVASHIRDALVSDLRVPAEKICVLPNGVDRRMFFPRSRFDACRKFGVPEETFNIVFVGTFDHLKGPDRVAEAVKGIDGVSLIFVGSGPIRPTGDAVVFSGPVEHARVAEILAAADLFVLPTAEEGCCNAVLEAMACGVPIVTSDGHYMDDIVDRDVALRADPYDVGAIRSAVVALKHDEAKRRAMAAACLRKSQQFDIDERAKRFVAWSTKLSR